MRRAATALGLTLLLGGLGLGAWLYRGRVPEPDYQPVHWPSALDGWKPPWPDAGSPPAARLPKRWIVMGWDGAGWDIALPLLEAGRLPHLASLMRGGAWADLWTYKPTQSAAVWTTVATGVSPARHAIRGFAKRPRGFQALFAEEGTELYSNADRRVRALWNLASEHERSVLVVGYHNTFPAEKVSGAMVSNYLVRQSILTVVPGARPDQLGHAAHLVYPPAAAPALAGLVKRIEDLSFEELRAFADVDRSAFESLMAEYRRAPHANARWNYLCKAYAYDEFHGRAALQLRDQVRPDFLLLHFQAPDWAAHHFFYFHDPRRFAGLRGVKALRRKLGPELPRYRKTLTAFYEFTDAWLGRLLEARDAETGVMVLSDHGMSPSGVPRETGSHNDAPAGIVVMNGPGIRPGRFPGASVYDVLPTLMASSGLPVARDLEGTLMSEAFAPGALSQERVNWVASYETGERFVPQVELGAALHEEMQQELRGLGYIQ
jgi:hypothetical protein